MNEQFYEDIFDQPNAIETTVASFREQLGSLILKTEPARILFTGSGDSYFASYALQFAARNHTGKQVYALFSNDAANYWIYKEDDLLIPISITGESKQTLKAAQKAAEAGAHVLSLTANPESSLAKASQTTIRIPYVSKSRRTPHAADYMATLTAICTIIELFSKKKLSIIDSFEGLIAESLVDIKNQDAVSRLSEKAYGTFYFLGSGPNYGTAQYAAAKFWEARGLRSLAIELEEVAHGPYLMVKPDDLVCIIAVSGENEDRALSDINAFNALGANVCVVTDREDLVSDNVLKIKPINEDWSPITACLPLQYLCYAYCNNQKMDVMQGGQFFTREKYDEAFQSFRGHNFNKLYPK